jgi:hypothetical protein
MSRGQKAGVAQQLPLALLLPALQKQEQVQQQLLQQGLHG